MNTVPLEDDEQVSKTRRIVRILLILQCADEAGFTPIPGPFIHTIAYLADALSPVWGLPILDAQVLKRRTRPNFPALQRDLDGMVGRGMVEVTDLNVSASADDDAPIRASFRLTSLAEPALSEIRHSTYFRRQFQFIREVTFAAAGLGPQGLASIGGVDASYAEVDFGNVVDLAESRSTGIASAQVAKRFRDLAPDSHLSDSQLVHLYLRHLHSRLYVA